MTVDDFSAPLDACTAQMLAQLAMRLQSLPISSPLQDAVQYAVMQGGKRIRPKLVFAAALAAGAEVNALSHNTYLAAMAIELIHCYSLIHDDLPCMDDDVLRRGLPTCHVQFGEATALLAGDYLQSLAFQLLSQSDADNTLDAVLRLQQLQLLSTSAAAMVEGQSLDLAAENKLVSQSELAYIHANKTGALIQAAVGLGVLSAGIALDDTLTQQLLIFADKLGLAYQVQDDLLDVLSDTQTLGKPAGSDQKLNKSTYPAIMGVDAAQKLAQQLHEQACDVLAQLPRSQALQYLTAQLLDRKF